MRNADRLLVIVMHVASSLIAEDVTVATANADQAPPRVRTLAALAAQVLLDLLDHLVVAEAADTENE